MTQRPNILLIMTDQHRLSAMGSYGNTPCRTPNLDRLAARGTRFETAYTTCPVCSPARGTVMTGMFPHTHGVTANVHDIGCCVQELGDHPDLLSRKLLSAGYRCGYTGKWHLGYAKTSNFNTPFTPSLPITVGFEGQNFPGHGGGGFGYHEYKQYLSDNGWAHLPQFPDPDDDSFGVLEGPEESTIPHFLTQHTLTMIDRYKEQDDPFFIWHNFWGPHGPYYVPREYYEMYRDVPIPEWPNFRWENKDPNLPYQMKTVQGAKVENWSYWEQRLRYYYAFTTLIDAQVGRMLDHLEASGIADNTIIVFTADHGETCGSHGGLIDKGFHHFEETHRIPMIVYVPEALRGTKGKPGVASQWASLADVYPTILDAAGAQFDTARVHGTSLLPIVRGETPAWRDTIATEFYGVNGIATTMIMLRHGNLKYGWNSSNKDELYDLENDPHEMTNLIDDPAYADRLRELRKRLVEWTKQTDHVRARNALLKTREL